MKRNAIVTAALVCALAIMALSAYYGMKTRQALEQKQKIIVLAKPGDSLDAPPDAVADLRGKQSPAFTLRDLNGRNVSLSDYRGKAVLINFWATWCAPCKVELPWLIALRKEYAPQGFEILGIDDDYPEDRKNVPEFSRKNGVSYPVLYSDDAVAKAYRCCDYYPVSVYVGRNGSVVEESVGLHSRDDIETGIKKSLSAAAGPPN